MLLILGCVLICGLLAAMFGAIWATSRRAEAQLSSARLEMQNSLAAQSQAMALQVNQQVGQLIQTMTQQLGQVRQELQTGVASSAQLATDAQKQVSLQLRSSVDTLVEMNQKIGEMRQSSQDLSKAAHSLQSILGGAKTRGTLGEATLDRLLADALPQNAYSVQFRFSSTGAIVDAVVRTGDRLLPIDSKFPLEAYRRLIDSGEEARRDFSAAVRKHAESIAEKYILLHEHTLDYALMFVPSEGVFYEMLMTADAKYGPLDEYCRGKHVFPVSPNTLYAMLSAICISLQGQKMEENARHLFAALGGLRKQIESFGECYEKLGTHLRHAQQNYEEADSRFEKLKNSFEHISQGSLADGASIPLEPAPLE